MAITQDYQFDYRGVTFGDGTNYDVIEIDIHSLQIDAGDRNNVRSHGLIPGIHRARGQVIECSLQVRGTPGSAALWNDIRALLTALSVDQYEQPDETEDQFHFRFPQEGENYVFARPKKRTSVRKNKTEFGLVPISFQLQVYDPRVYDATETDSGSQTGTFSVTNNGDALTYPIIVFDPDGSGNAKLTNNTNGSIIEFAGAGATAGLTWDGGRWVRSRSDLLIAYRSTTNYYDKLVVPRGPFFLSPGSNSLTLNTGDNVQVLHHDAWM